MKMGTVSVSPVWAESTQRLRPLEQNALTESKSLALLRLWIAFFNKGSPALLFLPSQLTQRKQRSHRAEQLSLSDLTPGQFLRAHCLPNTLI